MPAGKSLFTAGLIGMALTVPAEAQQRDFEYSGFTGIDIATGIDANVIQADRFSVQASSPSNDALDNLQLSVENGVLVARIESSFLDFILSGGLVGMLFNSGNAVTLDISVPSLTAATASSGADVDITGLTGDELKLDASSGADISLQNARIGTLRAAASSGSDIALSGRAERAELDASSGSDIDADDLTTAEAILQASSGANISVTVTETVRANASSGADIEIEGNPRRRDVDASSGGEVHFDD